MALFALKISNTILLYHTHVVNKMANVATLPQEREKSSLLVLKVNFKLYSSNAFLTLHFLYITFRETDYLES